MNQKMPLYPASTIAKLFNLSERRIRQLAKEGIIPKTERGKYELVGAVQGYVAYLQDRALGQEVKTTDIQAQRLRLIKAQADDKELELQAKRGELLPANEVKAVWSRLVIATKTGFLALPDRLKQMLTLSDKERDVIDAEVRVILTNLSAYEDKPDNDNVHDNLQNKTTQSKVAEIETKTEIENTQPS